MIRLVFYSMIGLAGLVAYAYASHSKHQAAASLAEPATVPPWPPAGSAPPAKRVESTPEVPKISPPSKPTALDAPTQHYRMEDVPIDQALYALGRAHNLTVVVEPDVVGKVKFETNAGSVRDVLRTIVEPPGYYFEEEDGRVVVRNMRTVLYLIEYPQLQRKSSATSSVTISSGPNYNLSSGSVYGGLGQAAGIQPALSGLGSSMNANGTADQNTFQITKKNENSFWEEIEAELRSELRETEHVSVSRFSGIAKVTAQNRRHVDIKRYVDLLNDRINTQVNISAEILEVTLNDDRAIGVDWTQLATRAGSGFQLAGIPGWGDIAAATNTGGRARGAPVNPSSFNADVRIGKLNALITALEEQGSVRTKSSPRISTLHNQTAYVKVGEDDAFFSLTKSTSITTPTQVSQTSTATENVYTSSTETFGTVFEVTPHVSQSGLITLDVQPVITKLLGIEKSPDLQQTRPNKEIKEASTILQLYDGETGVIAGFTQESTKSGSNRVPVLGSLPVAGQLFRTDTKASRRTEIVILITATVSRRRS